MTDRSSASALDEHPQTVAALVSVVAPSLARAPGVSPLLAHHDGDAAVAFGSAGVRSADQLRADVARVAAVLPAAEPDDAREILCVASDRYHFTVALLAAWQRGHRVALPPNAQRELLCSLAADPAISLVIHDTDEMAGLDLRELLAEAGRASASEPAELAPLPAERRLVTVWTSGSTGDHQRHAKTAGQLFAEALTLAEHFGLAQERDGLRVVATVPSHHIYGLLFSVLVPLVSGGSFLRETPLHAGVVRAALERTRASVLVSVPAHLRAMGILDPGALPNLSRVFSSGAALLPATARMLSERFGLRVTEVLGSTETGGIAWRTSCIDPDSEQAARAVWTPLPGVTLDVGPEGHMLIDSPFLPPAGPRPWQTADRIEPVAPPESAGSAGSAAIVRFRHLGRVDGVVKIGGKRVALAEIERRLHDIAGVEDAAVSVVEVAGARGMETVALVVAPGLSPEQLRSELRRWLDPVVIPRRLRLVDALPREANGKLTRRRLLEELARPRPRVRGLESQAVADEPGLFEVYVPRDLHALRGHFPGSPVVPGVLELELARERASELWPELGRLCAVRRLKFVRPLRAGQRVGLRLHRRPAADERVRVEFSLFSTGERLAAGQLEFAIGETAGR